MKKSFHERLRRQIEDCYNEPASVPESVQAVLATLEETVGEAELELALVDRLGLDGDPLETAAPATTAPAAVAERVAVETEILPDLLFVLDDGGTILECRGGNPGDLALPRERLIGRRISDCPIGNVGDRFKAALKKARKSREPVSVEYGLPCDGGLEQFEARLLRSGEDRFTAIVRNTTGQAKE
jgi:hypothetical protein